MIEDSTNSIRFRVPLRSSLGLALGAIGLLALAAPLVPLLGVPGYELSQSLTLVLGLFGGAAGLAATRRPPGRQRPARAALRTGVALALGALAAVAFVLVVALARGRCDPWRGLPFVLLLPLPTAFLAPALGALAGRLFERTWLAGLAYATLALGTLVATAAPIFLGPQVFAFNPIFGWFPGPLYDEALALPDALWIYRGLTLAATGATLALLAALSTRRPLRELALSISLGAAFVAGVAAEHRFGATSSVEDIDRALGGRKELPGLVLHFPRELRAEDEERLERTAALDLDEVERALGTEAPRPIDVFVYRSASEKGRLTGASQTHFTKPWLGQIHTQLGELDRVLRHELVHAVAAAWGRAPFDVCATLGGLGVQPGIVEGLAVAVDWPADELTVHQWSRAMREAGLAPNVRDLVGPLGFAMQAQERAYTIAGSFLRFLLDRHGRERLARLYRSGDFQGAYGRSLDALAADWERFLDTVPLEARARGAARDRFRRPALFGRPCARELAALRGEARSAEAAQNEPLAASLLGRCREIDPGDPTILAALWRTERRAGHREAAAADERRLRALPELDPVVAVELDVAAGDDAWEAGEAASATARFQRALGRATDPVAVRSIELRLAAVGHPASEAALRAYFDAPDSDLSLLGLLEAQQREPLVAGNFYLLGLRRCQRGRRPDGLADLARALALALPPDVAAQALRTSVSAEIDLGRWEDASRDLDRLAASGRPPVEELMREELGRRLAFEREHYRRPLVR